KYGIKLSSLKSKNRIRKDRDLKAGMVLNLQDHRNRGEDIPMVNLSSPAPARQVIANTNPSPSSNQFSINNSTQTNSASSSSKITHTVASGETLFAISKKYGVTVNQLKDWNNIGSQNIISIGQKLAIF